MGRQRWQERESHARLAASPGHELPGGGVTKYSRHRLKGAHGSFEVPHRDSRGIEVTDWAHYWKYHTLDEWRAAEEFARTRPSTPTSSRPSSGRFGTSTTAGTLKPINSSGDLATPEWRDLEFGCLCSVEASDPWRDVKDDCT